jgi:hypothetical protein
VNKPGKQIKIKDNSTFGDTISQATFKVLQVSRDGKAELKLLSTKGINAGIDKIV